MARVARPLRIERAGLWYHVTARGNERKNIFRHDRDRERFLALLQELVAMFSVRLHAFVLLDNHYHLLLELSQPNLSRAMHWLNVSYSVWFNRRHQRSGHLLQGRFKSVVVEPESWGLELSRYIHLNPVRLKRHGLGKKEVQQSRAVGVQSLTSEQVKERLRVLRNYRWSSYRAYLGVDQRRPWVCTDEILRLAGMVRDGAERYREHVEEGVRQGMPERPWDKVIRQAVLGTERFVAALRQRSKKEVEIRRLARRRTFAEIVGVVEKVIGGKWEEFRDRYGDDRRDMVLYLARREGMDYRQLCARGEVAYSSAAAAIRRFTLRLIEEKKLRNQIEQILNQMHNA